MAVTTPVSLAARERLREHQAAAAKAVASHSTSLGRLDVATTRRAQVMAEQDALVAAAKAQVSAAVATAAQVLGVNVAATVLDVSKAEVRRMAKEASERSARR